MSTPTEILSQIAAYCREIDAERHSLDNALKKIEAMAEEALHPSESAGGGAVWVKATTWPTDHNMVHWRRVEDKKPLLIVGRNYQNNIIAQFGKVYTPLELEWLRESTAGSGKQCAWGADEYPDLSSCTPEQKHEVILGLIKLAAKEIMRMFYAFGLKTHIECTVVNEPTNEIFEFSFVKLDTTAESGKEEAIKPLTEEEYKFMSECDIHPHSNGTAKILTENDEGAHLFPEDLLRLADLLYRYAKTEQSKK